MITEIRLQNFKCFKDEIIDIGPLTVLTGLNGTGKSSVIQSLLLLRQSYLEGVLLKGLSLNGDLISLGTGRDVLYERTEGSEKIGIKITVDQEKHYSWVFNYNHGSNFLHQAETPSLDPITLFTDDFEYLGAERIGPRNTYPKSYNIVFEHRHIGVSGEYTQHYLHTYGHLPIQNVSARYPDLKELNLILQVQAWLSCISPGVRLHTSEYNNADLINIQYQFADYELSNTYRPANVGFGITYVLPVLVALLKAQKESLLIIENPEAHLHPKGQRILGELISKVVAGGVQVIVETHSDHILNGIRLSVRKGILDQDYVKLHYFRRVSSKEGPIHQIISPNIKEDGRLDKWPDGFFDEWDKALHELF
jgi:predicted ATPase